MNPPAFQLYASDFMSATFDWPQSDVGAYIRLLCVQWDRGSIPDDSEKLKRLAGGKVSADVLSKFPLSSDGQRQNHRMEEVRNEKEEFHIKQSKNGKAGAKARWSRRHATGSPSLGNNGSDGTANGTAIDPALAKRWRKHSSPSPSPINTETPLPPEDVPTSTEQVETRRGGGEDSGDSNPDQSHGVGSTASGKVEDPEILRLIESVWAVWPKKIRELPAKVAIAAAIRRHGVEVVIAGTRAVAAADARRNVSPPGRYLPDPETFFDEGRYTDDPAQYGPREVVMDEAAMNRRVRELGEQIKAHPGNPDGAYTESKKQREKQGWVDLCAERKQMLKKLGQLSKED